jgi:hypothetical protein
MELSLAKNTKFYIAPLPPLYVWEERVLPIETPPRFESVGIPLPMLDIIN